MTKRGTEAPRPCSRVAVLAPLIHFSTHIHSKGSATKRERGAGRVRDLGLKNSGLVVQSYRRDRPNIYPNRYRGC
jgi:hypothetical protein